MKLFNRQKPAVTEATRPVRRHDFRKQGWGHALHWTGEPDPKTGERRLMGHGSSPLDVGEFGRCVVWARESIPSEGDELLVAMQSGKTAIYKLTECEGCRDPDDMWKGKALPIGYLGDDK